MFERMAKTPPEERMRLTNAAHAAVRGRRQSVEHRCKTALTIERNAKVASAYEADMIQWLTEEGISVTPQKAIGPYNIDIAIDESRIAVEIFGGNWHATDRHAARFAKRMEYLLRSGWTVIVIWACKGWGGKTLWSRASADYVIALHKVNRSRESASGEKHVIRGDGKTTPVATFNPQNGALILGVRSGNKTRDTNGRFA